MILFIQFVHKFWQTMDQNVRGIYNVRGTCGSVIGVLWVVLSCCLRYNLRYNSTVWVFHYK